MELQGNDGGSPIACHKIVLGTRSNYFETLLYGNFQEATKPVVKLDYSTDILHSIVSYCYTDQVPLLIDLPKVVQEGSSSSSIQDSYRSKIPVWVQLASAADYFILPKLSDDVITAIAAIIQENPTLAWDVIAIDGIAGGKFEQVALKIILFKFTDSIRDGVPSKVSSAVLERIISNKQVLATEVDIFCAVQSWYNNMRRDDGGNHGGSPPPTKIRKTESDPTNQQFIARSLIESHIQLAKIKPSDLETIVEPSGLVSMETLCGTYKEQAKLFQSKHDKYFTNTLRGPHWQSTLSTIFENQADNDQLYDFIDFSEKEMLPGNKFSWTVKVTTKANNNFGIGVVALPTDRTECLGELESAWAYWSDGIKFHAGEITGELPKVPYGGCIIQKKIDLTGNGFLTFRLRLENNSEKNEEIQLFNNLLLNENSGIKTEKSFVPAVYAEHDVRIEILEFIKLEE